VVLDRADGTEELRLGVGLLSVVDEDLSGLEVVVWTLLELESFVDDMLLVVAIEGWIELETFAEDLVEVKDLTSVGLDNFEIERELVDDTVRVKVDGDFTTTLPLSVLVEILLIFLVVELLLIFLELLLLIFLVLLSALEELVVLDRLNLEDLEVDVGFAVELVFLLGDDPVDLRLEVEDVLLLEEVLILLDDEVVFLLVGDWTLVILVIALVDEVLLVVFVDEVFLDEVPWVLEEVGFSLTHLQSEVRL
jgi:hypothetical protein